MTEIEATIADLERVAGHTEVLGSQLVTLAQKTCRDARSRLSRQTIAALVLGEPAAKAAFLDSVLGQHVFSAARAGPPTFVRHAAQPGYRAVDAKGQVVEFTAPEREQIAALGAELARAAPAAGDARAELAIAQAELSTRQQATTALAARVPGWVTTRPAVWAVWLWLARLLLGWRYRSRVRELAEERAQVERARARVDAARSSELKRAALEEQRARLAAATRALEERFAREVHALRESDGRELHVEFPAAHLAPGFVVLDVPALASADGAIFRRARELALDQADSIIVVPGQARDLVRALGATFPHLVLASHEPAEQLAADVSRAATDVLALAEPARLGGLLRAERDATIAHRLAVAAKAFAEAAAAVEARAADAGRERLAKLEALRIARSEELKSRELQKVREPAAQGALGVVEAARETLHVAIEHVAQTWLVQVQACSSKEQLKALVGVLGKRDEDKEMIASTLRQVETVVWAKTAEVVDRLQRVMAIELDARTETAQKLVAAPPVFDSGLESGPTEHLPVGVRDAIVFTDSGEAAAAAAGAVFISVMGGLFQGLEALKQDCAEKVFNGAGELELRLKEELSASAPTVSLGIESALAARMGALLSRFERALAGHVKTAQEMDIAERERLEPLRTLGQALAGHHQRIAALLGRA